MSKNVIMILVCLLAVVGLGLWLQYTMVQNLRSSSTLQMPDMTLKGSGKTGTTTTTTTTTTTGSATAPAVGKKTTLSAPVHKH